ncbi:hypothetical protein Dimus_022735 [Dionaea muscipula]
MLCFILVPFNCWTNVSPSYSFLMSVNVLAYVLNLCLSILIFIQEMVLRFWCICSNQSRMFLQKNSVNIFFVVLLYIFFTLQDAKNELICYEDGRYFCVVYMLRRLMIFVW